MASTLEEITYDISSLPMNQKKPRNQSLGNNRVYSQTYLILEIELLSVVFDLQNKTPYPLKLNVTCGKIKQRKGHSKINEQINISLIHG